MPPTNSLTACEACGRKNRVPAAARGTPRCGHCRAALPWIVDVDEAGFGEGVERSTVPVLLDLWAPWCAPCRMVSPALEQLAREHAGRLKLARVNVDESPGVSQRIEVRGTHPDRDEGRPGGFPPHGSRPGARAPRVAGGDRQPSSSWIAARTTRRMSTAPAARPA
jgi:thioredoxin 2